MSALYLRSNTLSTLPLTSGTLPVLCSGSNTLVALHFRSSTLPVVLYSGSSTLSVLCLGSITLPFPGFIAFYRKLSGIYEANNKSVKGGWEAVGPRQEYQCTTEPNQANSQTNLILKVNNSGNIFSLQELQTLTISGTRKKSNEESLRVGSVRT